MGGPHKNNLSCLQLLCRSQKKVDINTYKLLVVGRVLKCSKQFFTRIDFKAKYESEQSFAICLSYTLYFDITPNNSCTLNQNKNPVLQKLSHKSHKKFLNFHFSYISTNALTKCNQILNELSIPHNRLSIEND